MGYYRAGFNIVGVDIEPQPRYPFTFVQGDASSKLLVDALVALLRPTLIWASPPCQAHTSMSNRWRGHGKTADSHVNLIPRMRELLQRSRASYIIENVEGARHELRSPIRLTGELFGLATTRPRMFECSFAIAQPRLPPKRSTIGVYGDGPYGNLLRRRADGTEYRRASSLAEGRAALGIAWMEWRELAEAIPPNYAEWLARAFIASSTMRRSA